MQKALEFKIFEFFADFECMLHNAMYQPKFNIELYFLGMKITKWIKWQAITAQWLENQKPT